MQRIRLSVRENRLIDPSRITVADYQAALDRLGVTWVAEVEQRMAGFASAYRDGSIWALFVHPDFAGQGVGHALHQQMIAWLWSNGLDKAWLSTEQGTRAERFYRARGWRDGDRNTQLTSGEVELVLERL